MPSAPSTPPLTHWRTSCRPFRFGSALNLHVHLHAVVSDGAFMAHCDRWGRVSARFVPMNPPDEEEISHIRERVCRRVLRRAVRMRALPPESAQEMR
ncbi:MAG: transposase [Elusimicrobiota bacterium]